MKNIKAIIFVLVILLFTLGSCIDSSDTSTYSDPELGISFNYPANWQISESFDEDGGIKNIEFRDGDVWLVTVGILRGNLNDFNGDSAIEILDYEIEKRQSAVSKPEDFTILEEAQTIPHERFEVATGSISTRDYVSNLELPVDFRINFKVFKNEDDVLLFGINGKGGSKLIPSVEPGFNMIVESFDVIED